MLSWRWCTHIKRPGRFNRSRYRQIDRELSFLVDHCGHCPGIDPPPSVPSSGGKQALPAEALSRLALPTASSDTIEDNTTVVATAGGSGSGVGSKKKKKKSGSTAAIPPLKPQRLGPNDFPLRLLCADPCPDDFVPRKFTIAGGPTGPDYLLAELDRLWVHANKQCGGPDIAMDLRNKLNFFPPQLQWVFLMHLAKNPFTDHPYALLNIWHDIPMSSQKEERVGLIIMVLDWIIALYRLNNIWKNNYFDIASTAAKSLGNDSRINKTNVAKSVGVKPLILATPSTSTVFRPPTLSKEVCSFPRMLIGTIRRPRHSMADKLRLEAGLCWGNGEVTIPQQMWIQGWWNVAHMICYGCRLAYLFANSKDNTDLRCLVEQLRVSGCADVLIDKPAFGSHLTVDKPGCEGRKCKGGFARVVETSMLAYAIDSELAEIFEDLNWAEVEDDAKLHCLIMFSDYLCRTWTVDPLVLTLIDRAELKAFPLVLQFTILQQLSFAHSRLHQEALVWIVR